MTRNTRLIMIETANYHAILCIYCSNSWLDNTIPVGVLSISVADRLHVILSMGHLKEFSHYILVSFRSPLKHMLKNYLWQIHLIPKTLKIYGLWL